ncbi:HK97 family phage prohead protease [Paracoccus sp. p4-l81]|uniref:HK97 family phage prohead protease n=1 Tax=unclassified Paracoccus (in: a-proteobacteria) TaxID=2688777 RepID=UPI0035B7C37C
MQVSELGLEVKFSGPGHPVALSEGAAGAGGAVIEGYASLFGIADQGGDVVARGAYGASLKRLAASTRRVKMLWQHDATAPIGVWDEIREDDKGLWVKGRLLPEVARAREAEALLRAGAIDGLSIGYRAVAAERDAKGRRVLAEIDLWEVSLVTFPMLPEARVAAKSGDAGAALMALAGMMRAATAAMQQKGTGP